MARAHTATIIQQPQLDFTAAAPPPPPQRRPLWQREGEELARILGERRATQTWLAHRIGVQRKNVSMWCRGFEFTRANQALAARALDLPDDHFGPIPPEQRLRGVAHRLLLERLERETREAFGRFLRESHVATALTPADLDVLRSIRFCDGTTWPTKAFYEAVAFALMGAIRRDEILEMARVNHALDEAIRRKVRR